MLLYIYLLFELCIIITQSANKIIAQTCHLDTICLLSLLSNRQAMRLIFILALIDTFIASIQSKRFDPIKQNLKISSKINYFKSEFSNRIDPDIAEEINLSTVKYNFRSRCTCYYTEHSLFRFNFQPQLITKYNYSAEVHFITTEDGYILQAHRIAGSPQSAPCVGKPPVFLLHGTHESSSTWIIMRPLSSLGKTFLSSVRKYHDQLGTISVQHIHLPIKASMFGWEMHEEMSIHETTHH